MHDAILAESSAPTAQMRHVAAEALRFVDKAGRECAYYDTTLLFPTNAQTLSERPTRML